MYKIRQYTLFTHTREVPGGKEVHWRLRREGRGNEVRTDEFFPRAAGENDEDGLTKANEFLCGRGEQIIGIAYGWQGSPVIFTEPIPDDEPANETHSPASVEEDIRGSHLDQS